MGNHWGLGLFDNPEAKLWLSSVQADGWDALDAVLDEEESEDELDAAEGAAALVAAALITSLCDPMAAPLPAEAQPALQRLRADRNAMRDLDEWRQRALQATVRVLDEDSELCQLRYAQGDGIEWSTLVEELRDRLA